MPPPPPFSPAFSSSLYTTLKLRAVQSGAAMQDVRHEHVRTPSGATIATEMLVGMPVAVGSPTTPRVLAPQ